MIDSRPTSTNPSAITLSAGAIAQAGNITAIRACVDNVAVLTTNNPATTKSFQLNSPINVAPGTHHLVAVAYPAAGRFFTANGTITIQ